MLACIERVFTPYDLCDSIPEIRAHDTEAAAAPATTFDDF